MSPEMRAALLEYGRTIKKEGWTAGIPIIEKYKNRFPDFEKWAMAMATYIDGMEELKKREEEDGNRDRPR